LNRFARRRKVTSILSQSRFRRAGRAAKDARGFDGHEKDAVETGVALLERSFHGLRGWQMLHELNGIHLNLVVLPIFERRIQKSTHNLIEPRSSQAEDQGNGGFVSRLAAPFV
jgi:hypothetical protein